MPREPRQHICNARLQILKRIRRESPEYNSVDRLEELSEDSVFTSQGLDNLHREINQPSQQQKSTCYNVDHGNSRVPVLSIPEVTLSAEQTNILEIVKNGGNVFFTGPAGTGKSVLLRAIISALKRADKVIAVTATTGIAALGIGGQTLHSFAGINTGEEVAELLYMKVNRSTRHRSRWRSTQVWIIDEVSMLKSDLFDKLDYIARTIRNDQRPFGGIQLVLAGDFFQLPPIAVKGTAAPSNYVFSANTWKDCFPFPYFLRQVFRQKDNTFIQLLSSLRVGHLSQQHIATLRSLERPLPISVAGAGPALLLPRNKDVKEFNLRQLEALPGNQHKFFSMDYAGWDVYREEVSDREAKETLNSTTLAPESLVLKVGAQVMLIQNVEQGVLVNGSIGRVVKFITISEALLENIDMSIPGESNQSSVSLGSWDGRDYYEDSDLKAPPIHSPYQHRTWIEDNILSRYKADPSIAQRATSLRDMTGHVFPPQKAYPLVHFNNNHYLLCIPMFFDRTGLMGNIEARRVQVPLILSWAITIHKSQGQTLDFVRVDMKRIFTFGQAYVAVSRATSMDGLQVVNFRPDRVYTNPHVVKWHAEWQNWWEEKMREETA